MKGKKRVIAALCFLCLGTALAAAGCNNQGDKPTDTDVPPVISVEKDEFSAGTYVVGQPITLPKASASDQEDGDVSSSVKLRVLFHRDDEYILFDGEDEEVKGNTIVQFTPEKCGKYTAIYTVRDRGGNTTREEISFQVVSDGQEKPSQLLANQADWTLNANTAFDAEGNAVFDSTKNASLAYNNKLENGDLVQFRFNGSVQETRYFTVGSILSTSSEKDAPVADESTFPGKYLSFCIRSGAIEFWLARTGGVEIQRMQKDVKLLDGKDHTIAFRYTLEEDGTEEGLNNAVTVQLWIDADPAGRATYEEKIVASALLAQLQTQFGEESGTQKFNSVCAKIFKPENFVGFFNAGASQGKGDFAIKSVGLNGEQRVSEPVLQVEFDQNAKYFVDRAVTFPKPILAEDGNNYADLSNRVALKVIKMPVGGEPAQEYELEGYTFTPESAGFYQVVYSVTDYSGNKAFVYCDFTVASSEEATPPVIVLSGEEREFAAKVGQSVTLPSVVSAIDGDGIDYAEYVTVTLEGSEGQVLSSLDYIFRTVGTHTVTYSVLDMFGNPVTETVIIEVTCDEGKGLLPLDTDHFGTNVERQYNEENGHVITGIKLMDDYRAAYKGRKIYSEKVSFLLDVPIASAFNADDGFDFLQFGLRSDLNAQLAPNDPNWGNFPSWLSGLFIEVDASDGLVICGGNRENRLYQYKFPEGTRKTFEGRTTLTYQVTDVFSESGRFNGISIEVWVNGEPLKMGADTNAYVIPARRTEDYMRKSGWLNFSAHAMKDGGRGNNKLHSGVILAVTIDGVTQPQTFETTLAENLVKNVHGDEQYTVPDIGSVKLGGEEFTDYDIYVESVSTGESVKVNANSDFSVSGDYFGGFWVKYCYGDMLLARYLVEVEVEVDGAAFEGETFNLTAEFGQAFAIPKVLYYVSGGHKIENPTNINVKVRYDGEYDRKLVDVTGDTFTPIEKKSFTLCYFVGSTPLDELEVVVEGGGDIASLTQDLAESSYTYWVSQTSKRLEGNEIVLQNNWGNSFWYKTERFYDEKITLDLDMGAGNSMFCVNLRGNKMAEAPLENWPYIELGNQGKNFGLWFYIEGDNFRLCYGHRGSGLYDKKLSSIDASLASSPLPAGTKLSWQTIDEMNAEGEATGVRVKVWLQLPNAEEALLCDTVVSAQGRDGLFNSYYLLLESFGDQGNATTSTIKNISIARTAPAKVKNYDIRYNDSSSVSPFVVVGKEYTFDSVTVLRKGIAVDESEIEYFVRDKDGAETKVNKTFTPGDKYADGMTVVYKVDGHALLTASKMAISGVTKVNDGTQTPIVGQPFTAAEYTARLYVNADAIVSLTNGDWTIQLIPQGGGAIPYTAGMILPEECANGFTVTYTYGREAARYEAEQVLSVQTAAEKNAVVLAGAQYTAPEVNVLQGGAAASGEVAVKVLYGQDGQADCTAPFTVSKEYENGFKVQYLYHGAVVFEIAVEVVSVQTENAEQAVIGWDYELPDCTLTVNGTAADGLEIYISADGKESEYKGAFAVGGAYEKGFTVLYRYKGVTVHSYEVTAEAIAVSDEAEESLAKDATVYTVHAITATLGETAIPAEEVSTFIVIGDGQPVAVEGEITITAAHKGGFKIVYRWKEHDIFTLSVAFSGLPAVTPVEGNRMAIVGGTYTLSELTVTVDGETVAQSEIKKYIVVGEEPADYETADEAEATLNVTDEHAEGFKVVYRYNGETVYTMEVAVTKYTVTFAGSTENLTATKGYDFVLPVPTVKNGDTVVTEGVVQTLVSGETRTPIENGAFDVLETYQTVTVEVSIQGIVLASYTVTAQEDTVATHVLKWSTEMTEATVNQAFTVPEVLRYRLDGERKEGVTDIKVELVYEGSQRKAIALTGATYTPVEKKNFTLSYYLGETLLDTIEVSMQGGGNIADLLADVDFNATAGKVGNINIDGGVLVQNAESAFVYKEQQFYDEKITVTFDEIKFGAAWAAPGTWVFGINLRGDRKTGTLADNPMFVGKTENGDDNGLWLQLKVNEGIRLTYGNRDTGVKALYADSNKANWHQEFIPAGTQLSWQVTDVFENGAATGVQVKVWLKAPDAETETAVIDTFLSANDYPDLFNSYYFVTSTLGSLSNEADYLHKISNIKVERAKQENE